eukprot:1614402-Pleurochrysis_carterae.AAC.1
MGVCVTVSPRTESSIPLPMAINPVTRQLAFNAMSPQLEAMRPIAPDGQVALHFISLVIFAQRMHPTQQTLDDHVWVATLEENWGADLWPAMFTQASESDLSTMTSLPVRVDPLHFVAQYGVGRNPGGREQGCEHLGLLAGR